MTDTPLSDDVVERVARALCTASQGQWRTNNEQPSSGLPRDFNFDGLNNHWRHSARAALEAARYGEMAARLERLADAADFVAENTAMMNDAIDDARALLSSIGASQP